MITNSKVTLFHKTIEKHKRLEKWIRQNYDDVWFFGGRGAGLNKGYADANDVEIRIPYNTNKVDMNNISVGDIIVQGKIERDIETQQDLSEYEVYNITSISDNPFGNNPHLHLGGR